MVACYLLQDAAHGCVGFFFAIATSPVLGTAGRQGLSQCLQFQYLNKPLERVSWQG